MLGIIGERRVVTGRYRDWYFGGENGLASMDNTSSLLLEDSD
jgi:hypothetical protein